MRGRRLVLAAILVGMMGLLVSAAEEVGLAAEDALWRAPTTAESGVAPSLTEGEFVAKDFAFRDGERMAELRLHYATLGTPARDAAGHVTNAVMILHGTGGTGGQFLAPQFAGELFGPGQLLDTAKYFIILPDGIGHGKSSKPSDGLHAKFPQYDYDDMVAAQHALLEHLGVEPDKVTENASFIDDLGADSLDTVELVMAFEEEFGCEIPDDAAETILTVGDAIKFLEKNAKS